MEDTPAAIRKLEAEKAVLLAQLYRTRHGMDVAEASRTLKDYVISKIANKEEPLRSTFRDANGQPNLWKQVVKRPMDYGTIAQRLKEGRYGGGGGGGGGGAPFDGARFAGDLRLVTYNARIYNEVGTTLWRMADVLHRATETALRDRLRLSEEQAAQLAEATAVEQATPVMRWPDIK